MPDGHGDEQPVTWGRWNEAHTALVSRVSALEAAMAAAAGRRSDRTRTLILAVLTGLVLPSIVLLIGVGVHRALG